MAQQNDDGGAAANAADEVRDETAAAAETVASEVENVEGKVGDVATDTAESVGNALNPSSW